MEEICVARSRGQLAHVRLCEEPWLHWMLLGDSVSIQWVPSHGGIVGDEGADEYTRAGADTALRLVEELEGGRGCRELSKSSSTSDCIPEKPIVKMRAR